VQGLAVAILVRLVLTAFGEMVPVVDAWAVATVCVLAIRLHRTVLPPGERRRASRMAARRLALRVQRETAAYASLTGDRGAFEPYGVDPLPPTLERRFARMYRHTDRLSYAVVAERHFDAGVRPVLADLARDRLRRYAGIDPSAHPDLAQHALGPELWRALEQPLSGPPTLTDIDRWVTSLERLDPRWQPLSERLPAPGPAGNWTAA
jgi:hypothetical protein